MPDMGAYGWQPERIRRFFLTALLYLLFALGAVVTSLFIILPIALVLRARRVKYVRSINRLAFNAFVRLATVFGVFEVSFVNVRKLEQPSQLIIANHPSLLDVVFLLGRVPNANCVVKKNLLKNPFLAIPVYFADYIINDKKEELLENCIASLKKGDPLIIFPEGTRSVKERHYEFKRGATHLMLTSNCPVRLVYISCEPSALDKKSRWYMIPKRKITYRFTVMGDLDMKPVRQSNEIGVPGRSRRLNEWLMNWYETVDCDDLLGPVREITLPSRLYQKTPTNQSNSVDAMKQVEI